MAFLEYPGAFAIKPHHIAEIRMTCDDAGEPRFNGSFYESATYAPRLGEAAVEVRFTRDATPADRVREVFGQFVPSEYRRGKHYSSAATAVIR